MVSQRNNSVQPQEAERHVRTHNTTHVEADELQQQKAILSSTPIYHEQVFEAKLRPGDGFFFPFQYSI